MHFLHLNKLTSQKISIFEQTLILRPNLRADVNYSQTDVITAITKFANIKKTFLTTKILEISAKNL